MKHLQLIITTFMLMSCADSAHKQAIVTDLPDEFTSSDIDSINKIQQFWDNPFNNNKLSELLNSSLENNLDIQQAWLNLKIASSNFKVLKASNNPKLDLVLKNEIATTNYKDSKTVREETNNLDLALSWQIDIWGKINKYAEVENFEYKASSLDYIYTKQLIANQIITNYLTYNYLAKQIELHQQYLDILNAELKYTTKLYQAGEVSLIDLNNAKLNVNNKKVKLTDQNNSLSLIKQNIAILSNKNVQDLNLEITDFNITNIEEFSTVDIKQTRHDLKASEFRFLKQVKNTQAKKLERLPSLDLTLSYGLTATTISDLYKASLFNSLAGLTMPIFNSGSIKQNIKKAESEQELALLSYLQNINTALNEITTNYDLLKSNYQALDLGNKAIELSTNSLAINKQLYNAGQANYLSLSQYKKELIDTKIKQLTLKQNYLQQVANTYNSLGGYNK
jgi:outer membrane protein TolC